jgi:hypothetical protein
MPATTRDMPIIDATTITLIYPLKMSTAQTAEKRPILDTVLPLPAIPLHAAPVPRRFFFCIGGFSFKFGESGISRDEVLFHGVWPSLIIRWV